MLIFMQTIQDESDRSIVEELYNKYSSTMLYIAQSILKDRDRAEDAVSQAFLKIIDKLQKFSFENCNKTRGLVVIIVRNICYDMLKAEKSQKNVPMDEYEDIPEDSDDAPLEHLLSEESYKILISNLSKLNEKSRDVLILKYVYEYSDNEISDFLGITPGNVRVRFHRAKKALKKKLEEGGTENE